MQKCWLLGILIYYSYGTLQAQCPPNSISITGKNYDLITSFTALQKKHIAREDTVPASHLKKFLFKDSKPIACIPVENLNSILDNLNNGKFPENEKEVIDLKKNITAAKSSTINFSESTSETPTTSQTPNTGNVEVPPPFPKWLKVLLSTTVALLIIGCILWLNKDYYSKILNNLSNKHEKKFNSKIDDINTNKNNPVGSTNKKLQHGNDDIENQKNIKLGKEEQRLKNLPRVHLNSDSFSINLSKDDKINLLEQQNEELFIDNRHKQEAIDSLNKENKRLREENEKLMFTNEEFRREFEKVDHESQNRHPISLQSGGEISMIAEAYTQANTGIFYLSTPTPTSDGYCTFLDQRKLQFDPVSSLYRFKLINENEAQFWFEDREVSVKTALRYPEGDLKPACDYTGLNSRATKILTEKPGKAIKQSDYWKVTQKAKIKFS